MRQPAVNRFIFDPFKSDPSAERPLQRHSPRLSVNLNKIALLRNARRTGVPNIVDFARLALEAGADGLTVHPRPDGRHIRYEDVLLLKKFIATWPGAELNIEGCPTPEFLKLVLCASPHQCTLVPDEPGAFTSDSGWNLTSEKRAVEDAVAQLKLIGCRTILFFDPSPRSLGRARALGADGIEIYTGHYAAACRSGDAGQALSDIQSTACQATALGLMVNAGHDLTTENLGPLIAACEFNEVSIGHELAADALTRGFAQTVRAYRQTLRKSQRIGSVAQAFAENAGYRLRSAQPGDLDLICRHRHEMFKASGRTDAMLQPMTTAFRAWLQPRLADGRYFGWMVDLEGRDVAGLGMMVMDWPPHPSHPGQEIRGYILNVFVEVQYRRRGLAHELMGRALAEARARGLQHITLHATAMGAPVYEALGWRQTSEMSISL